MYDDNKSEGQRYSFIYLKPPHLLDDCPLFRRRLATFLENKYTNKNLFFKKILVNKIEEEIGIKIPQFGVGLSFYEFYNVIDFKYILDSITIIYRCLKNDYAKPPNSNPAKEWLEFVERVFREQNLAYKIDTEGGVLPFVDEEFEANRSSSLKCLENPKYAAAKKEFDDCYRKLIQDRIDTEGAIVDMFKCVEIIFKLLCENASRLSGKEIGKHLPKILETIYNNPDHLTCAKLQMTVLSSWADASHYQRHGQAVTEPRKPPLDITVFAVSVGSSMVRWLIEIGDRIQNTDPNRS